MRKRNFFKENFVSAELPK